MAKETVLEYNGSMNLSRFVILRARAPLALSLVAIAFIGCIRSKGVLRNNLFQSRETRYHIGEAPEHWKRVSLSGADIAYLHEHDGATLLVNSECRKAEDAPLVALTFHLLIGMTEQNIIDQKTLQLADREALETTVEAKIDGVKRKLQILVLKKDGCVYDIVLSAPPEKFEEDVLAYQALVSGFDIPRAKL